MLHLSFALFTVIGSLLSSHAALIGHQYKTAGYYDSYDEYEDDYGCKPTAQPPTIDSQCCGVDTASNNYIVGGNATSLQQYPWLALVEYRNENTNKTSTACGGFLISGRYVVTAAHCLTGEILQEVGKPVNVYLGEYNRTNEGPDCITSPSGQKVCSDGAIKFQIESYAVHPKYDRWVVHANDIGIMRLQSMAPYTEFIRPICLPTSDLTADPPANLRFHVAGWGVFDQKKLAQLYVNSYSSIKRHVDVPLRNIKECREVWNKFVANIQICAGGEEGKDSCTGDSGGPLMHATGGVYQAVGMVSYGSKKCGLKDVPSVYINVYHYRDWIYSHIKN